jgi:hypothetical protein
MKHASPTQPDDQTDESSCKAAADRRRAGLVNNADAHTRAATTLKREGDWREAQAIALETAGRSCPGEYGRLATAGNDSHPRCVRCDCRGAQYVRLWQNKMHVCRDFTYPVIRMDY